MSERPKITYPIPVLTPAALCRGCKAEIYWIKTPAGKAMPVDPDGTPHWATCERAADFKRPAKASA